MAAAPAAAFAAGDRALLNYGEPGGPFWHVRMVLGHVHGHDYVVLTPDFDTFVEELSTHNADLEGFRVMSPGGGAPPGLGGATMYGFRPMTAAERRDLIAEGRRMGQAERAALGLAAPAAVGLPGVAPAPVDPALAAPIVDIPAPVQTAAGGAPAAALGAGAPPVFSRGVPRSHLLHSLMPLLPTGTLDREAHGCSTSRARARSATSSRSEPSRLCWATPHSSRSGDRIVRAKLLPAGTSTDAYAIEQRHYLSDDYLLACPHVREEGDFRIQGPRECHGRGPPVHAAVRGSALGALHVTWSRRRSRPPSVASSRGMIAGSPRLA